MARTFVFVKDIESALKEGKTEIEFPEGTRISLAALDLIKEKGIQIIRKTGQGEKPDTDTGEPPGNTRKEEAESESAIQERLVDGPSPLVEDGTLSEDDLEAIVNRVIRRFREIKGQKPPESEETDKAPEDDDDLVICRCEEITKGEIKGAIRNGMKTLNGIKRVTRAGMGLCQGQTCQRLVSQILAGELGVSPGKLEPTTARAPVRPLKLSVLATG